MKPTAGTQDVGDVRKGYGNSLGERKEVHQPLDCQDGIGSILTSLSYENLGIARSGSISAQDWACMRLGQLMTLGDAKERSKISKDWRIQPQPRIGDTPTIGSCYGRILTTNNDTVCFLVTNLGENGSGVG